MEMKSVRMDFMLVLVESKMRRISSTYRKKFIKMGLLARLAICEASK